MDKVRIGIFVCGLAVGLLAVMLFNYEGVTDDVIGTLISVYAILGGFIVGLMALTNDPNVLDRLSNDVATAQIAEMERQSDRIRVIFFIYLATLISSVLFLVFRDFCPAFGDFILGASLFLGSASLIWSLELPRLLYALQRQRIDAVRQKLGIPVPSKAPKSDNP